MPWVKVDDGFHTHIKLAYLGDQHLPATGLWILALSWAAQQLTDGFVPAGQVQRLGGSVDLAEILVRAGLWKTREGGYQIHDYLEYNPSAESVRRNRQALHEQRAEAGRQGGRASGRARRSAAEANQKPAQSDAEAPHQLNTGRGHARASADRSPEPDPDPDPETERLTRRDRPSGEAGSNDVARLLERLYGRRASPKQLRMLAEMADRHSDNWVIDGLQSAPDGVDPIAHLRELDNRWKTDRRSALDRQEDAWAATKRADRAGAPEALRKLTMSPERPRRLG